MASQGTILSGQKNSAGSSLLGMVQAGASLFGGSSGSSANTTAMPDVTLGTGAATGAAAGGNIGIDSASDSSSSAIDRRVDANNQHPDVQVAQALKYLDDPDNGMDYHTRMAAAEPLLRSQYFGYGGGYQKGSQGEIRSGKAQDSGGLSKVVGAVAEIV